MLTAHSKKRLPSPNANRILSSSDQLETQVPPPVYHPYKTRKTTNGARTQIAAAGMKDIQNNGTKMGCRAQYPIDHTGSICRADKRDKQLEKLVVPIMEKVIACDKPTFFHGHPTSPFPDIHDLPSDKHQFLRVHDHLEIVDTTSGAYLPGIFSLSPRNKVKDIAIKKMYGALYSVLMDPKQKTTLERSTSLKPGEYRQPHFETTHQPKYFSFGEMPLRNKQGIFKSMKGIDRDPGTHELISRFVRKVENIVKQDLPSRHVKAQEWLKNEIGYKGFPFPKLENNKAQNGKEQSEIYSTIACGYDVFLPAHFDEDFFWSTTTVLVNEDFIHDDKIKNYFCFPGYGVAVALRPGDVLIFNPSVLHCVSTRNTMEHVICLSLYVKTKNIAGNDVSQQLTPEQKEMVGNIFSTKEMANLEKNFKRKNKSESLVRQSKTMDKGQPESATHHCSRHHKKKSAKQPSRQDIPCTGCGMKLPWEKFAKAQRKKSSKKAKWCLLCVANKTG